MSDQAKCALCGEPMPEGEEMFKFHGYSGNCPKPPLPKEKKLTYEELTAERDRLAKELEEAKRMSMCELMTINASAKEYAEHWESRTLKAEAERDRLAAQIKEAGEQEPTDGLK